MRIEIDDEGNVEGYLTTSEYAKRAHVQQVTVRQWIRRKKIKALKVGSQLFVKDTEKISP